VNGPIATLLLGATWAVPFALLLACMAGAVRRVMPRLLWLAPLPALAAALLALAAPALEIGAGRLRLVFELDGPGALLLGVAALLWSAAGAYAATYMRDTAKPGRFVACWLMACTGCLGVFVAGDLVSLYAMLAMLTLGASGLVIHDETAQAWRSGSIYLVLALLAESVLLVGLVMLAGEIPGDSLRLRDAAAALATSPDRNVILALLVAGFGTKAGLVPMHVWMPLAHAAAPVPASAVLSGAVVKVGIIGLIRFLPLSEALPDWGLLLTAVGFVTAFYAVAIGLTQRHPKAVLAYSSVSQMGVVAAVLGMGLAAGDATSGMAAAFYASHHVLVKGALFLSVGVVAASGAGRRAVVLVPAMLLCLGLGGLPFTGGAIAKYAVKDQLDVGVVGWLAAASAVGTTLLMLHFFSRLASFGNEDPQASASMGLRWPWLAMAAAALVLPWLLHPMTGLGPTVAAIAPKALWASLWPVALGAGLALALRGWAERLPTIPQGDIAEAIDHASRAALAGGPLYDRFDGVIRTWPAATLALLLTAIAFGAALIFPWT
jgi:formate hydrogenlyase subunit 3/multisubunit Na+/H+ antiporter MnhD subunit